MRLFAAIDISQAGHGKITQLQSELKRARADVKWVDAGNLHLTLKFLGETGEGMLGAVKEKISLAIAGIKPFELSFGGCEFFFAGGAPKVLWLKAENGADAAAEIASKLDAALEELGFAKEARPFSAHLTLGRFRSGAGFDTLKKIIDAKKTEIIREKAGGIILVKSVLTPAGPVYETLEEFRLDG